MGESCSTPSVFIVILNWNGWKDSVECLESVFGIDYRKYEALVVDNASTDDSVGQIERWARARDFFVIKLRLDEKEQAPATTSPSEKRVLTILQSPQNRGYAGGNNLGIAYALERRADFVVLLNNDTLVEPGFLRTLVEAAQSDSRAAIVGSVILSHPDGEVTFSGGRVFLLRTISPRKRSGKERYWESDYVIGCSMLLSRTFLECESHWLDERLFLYGEELEICARARRKGFRVLVAGDSRVYHKISASIGQLNPFTGKGINPAKAYYIYRNKLLMFRELLSPAEALVFVLVFHVVLTFRLCQALLTGNSTLARAILEAVKDGWRRIGGRWRGEG